MKALISKWRQALAEERTLSARSVGDQLFDALLGTFAILVVTLDLAVLL